jgi:hypothetical protein
MPRTLSASATASECMHTTSLNLADHWQDVCGMGIRIALVRNHTLCLSKGQIGTISEFRSLGLLCR